ncbi:acetyl-CoA synthetase-like protein [Gautieria morchelliformis]|nr:acetyl-CoA synthetase-like protein [Gautieria morchelliformis]
MQFLTPQGVDSVTFTAPPLDGSLMIPEIYEAHAKNSPNHPLFVFADASRHVRTVYYPEGVQAMRNAARIVESHYSRCKGRYISQKQANDLGPTFGILATTDTISYSCLTAGIMSLGCTAFPISTRNSPPAIAHLISKMGVIQLFVSPDPAMQRLSRESLDLLARDGHSVEILPIPRFEELFLGMEGKQTAPVAIQPLQIDRPGLILHSSGKLCYPGSTAFPKPITLTHRMLLQWGSVPYYGQIDICSKTLAVHALPMFHGMGVSTLLWTVLLHGVILGCFEPILPPTIPTPESVLKGIINTNSDIVFCVPSFVEHWTQDPNNIAFLKALTAIVYAGAPMSKSAGDQLTQQGVPLVPIYGCTEAGNMSMLLPAGKPSVDEWEYFKFSPHVEMKSLPYDGITNVYEVFMLGTDAFTPAMYNTTINKRNAYAVGDLLVQHPTDPTRWKIYGRVDDQIMLSTGEKTNPGPLEAILLRDPHISAAVMFGRERVQNGVLIEPKKEYLFEVNNETKLESFKNAIWFSVERLNAFAPSHSRLFKEMIIVTSAQKPLEYTAKGTPRRRAALKIYAEEIEAAYAAVKESAQTNVKLPEEWTSEAVLKFVRMVVKQALVMSVRDVDDIFQYGCDSLQATRIHNILMQALREAPTFSNAVNWRPIPQNFVYAHPSVSSLSAFISSVCLVGEDGKASNGNMGQSKLHEMEALVAKYTASIPDQRPSKSVDFTTTSEDTEVILLTGSTGHLGCYLLAQLLALPTVVQIFALNRPSTSPGIGVYERQREAFLSCGLDLMLLSSPKLQLLEMNTESPYLGLQKRVFDQIQNSITGVIHNAWRVDFNLSLASFEPLIKSTMELINLSLSSPRANPPYFLFTSSISVLRNFTSPEPAEETSIPEPCMAVGTGYSESKWVTERILEAASQKTTMRTTVVRIGQLSGGSKNGAWNVKEWVPAIIRGGQIIGCLPLRDEEVAWIPLDVAAASLVEMRNVDHGHLHLVHPKPVEWSDIFMTAANILQLPLIPYTEWLSRLEALHRSGTDHIDSNPALRLLDFFRTGSELLPDGSGRYQRFTPSLQSSYACQVSATLANVDCLDKQCIEQWVGYWRGVGFLEG